ncbi:hypothetical protein [Nonomuraea dietziae]
MTITRKTWITQYDQGQRSGDQATVGEATAAMQSSRDWAILQEAR